MMKTYVYIDGFNLYYGCIRWSAFKWLDLSALCVRMLPSHFIARIKYFTAPVKPRPDDPDQRNRQMAYFRALKTITNLTIIQGRFLENEKSLPIADCCKLVTPGVYPRKLIRVIRSEEKGSDVNLASHLLMDGFNKVYQAAVVVSNDSDLAEPIRMVRHELGLPVGILNPHEYHSIVLKPLATFLKRIRKSDLGACQFPTTLRDRRGEFQKPAAW